MDAADQVRKALPQDVPEIGTALGRAFFHDALFAWAIPDDDQRRPFTLEFFTLYATAFLRHDQTYTTGGKIVAAALWAPPGAVPISSEDAEELGQQMEELAVPDAARFLELNKLFDEHHPHGSYWYLQFMGVDPAWQGQGIGSRLMAPVLERCDREASPPTWTPPTSAIGGCTSGMGSRPRIRSLPQERHPCGRCGGNRPRVGSDF